MGDRRAYSVCLLLGVCACGGGSGGHDAAGPTFDAGPRFDAAPLSDPAPGEWPMFKRSLAHTGFAPGRGAITAATLCEKWPAQVTVANTRGASGALIAEVNGEKTVFVAVQGCPGATQFSCSDPPGKVLALRGSDGSVIWPLTLPKGVQADPYAPLLADVDGDGFRELIVPSSNTNQVFAIRTEDEPDGARGTIDWPFAADDDCSRSETAPSAADLDPDNPGLEIVLGTDNDGPTGAPCPAGIPPKFYVIDGVSGTKHGEPYEALIRDDLVVPPDDCPRGNKIDSSSPAIAEVGGRLVVYVGSWDGHLYAFQWSPAAGAIERAWDDPLPPSLDFTCPIRKVRNGPTVADLIPGAPLEVVFGYMEDAGGVDNFDTARLRIDNADGLANHADLPIRDWKSTPSVAELDGDPTNGPEIAGGTNRGYYVVHRNAGMFEALYDLPYGTTMGESGNRSSPAIADIDGAAAGGDAALEIILGIEGTMDPGLVAIDGATGDIEWSFPLPAPGMQAAPAVGNIDDDAELEIVFFAADGFVHALDSDCP